MAEDLDILEVWNVAISIAKDVWHQFFCMLTVSYITPFLRDKFFVTDGKNQIFMTT